MADPFDQSDPGFNDPNQNLMNFGNAMMANSAGPGAVTLATAMGKAGLSAADQSRQNNTARSENTLRGAQTAGLNMNNQMQLFAMNAMRQHFNQPPMQMGPNGQLIPSTSQQAIQAPQMQSSSPQTMPAATASSSAQPQESQGMTGPTWAATPANQRSNGSGQTNAYPAGSSGNPAAPREAAFMPPTGGQNPMMPALTQAESGGNPNALSPKGAAGAYQIMPATARDPGYGVQPLQNWDGQDPRTAPQAEQARFANDYLNAVQSNLGGSPQLGAAAYNAGPGRVQQVIDKLPPETQGYVKNVAGTGQQPASQQQPQQNNDPYAAPAGVKKQDWDQALMLNQLGNPYGKSALEAMGKAPYTTIDARQGGIAYNPGLGITAVGRLEGETPGGAKYLTPPGITGPGGQQIGGEPPNQGVSGAGGQYSGVPQGSTLTSIGPGADEQIKNEMEFHTNGEHGELKSYNASVGSQQNLTQLQSYLDTLNAHQGDPNFLASGAGSEMRTEGAKMLNTAWNMAGGDPKNAPFDPNTVSAAEASYKTANLLGMQLINSQFGASREAASVIQTGLKSVPSMENTPQGARLLLNGAKEVSNNTIDRYTFKEWWARPDGPHPGDLRGADVAFNQAFPPQLYAKRAISQEQPIDISGLKTMPNLLPGTQIRYGNAPPKIVPQAQQLPFVLPSINGQNQ